MTFRQSLLVCGAFASALYVGIDVLVAIRYPEYHSFTSRLISELMASGAPTERLVDPLFLLYDLLMMAFAVGVWKSGREKRLHITAALLFAYAALGLLGPTVFEMNVRGSGGNPMADILHGALTGVLVLLIFASVGFGGSIRGRSFRHYSFATIVIMIAFGVLTAVMAPTLDGVEPTPWLGALERLNIGAFLLWVVVFAISLWRTDETDGAEARRPLDGRTPSAPLPTQ